MKRSRLACWARTPTVRGGSRFAKCSSARPNLPMWTDDSVTRRHALSRFANGFGMLGLAGLLGEEAVAAPHFPAQAKRVIFLFMAGGPSQADLFDPKPKLAEMNGQPLPF